MHTLDPYKLLELKNPDAIAAALLFALRTEDAAFRHNELKEYFGYGTSKACKAMKVLRERGFIRRTVGPNGFGHGVVNRFEIPPWARLEEGEE